MDLLVFLVLIALVILCVIGVGVFLLKRGAKNEVKTIRVIGIILCAVGGLGILGLGILIWLLSLNASPYS